MFGFLAILYTWSWPGSNICLGRLSLATQLGSVIVGAEDILVFNWNEYSTDEPEWLSMVWSCFDVHYKNMSWGWGVTSIYGYYLGGKFPGMPPVFNAQTH